MTSTTDRYRQGPTDPLAAAPRPLDPGATMGSSALDLDGLLQELAL